MVVYQFSKLGEFQIFVDPCHLSKVSVVVEKAKFMFDGDLCDETIDGTSNGDALLTTVEVQIASLFITKNRVQSVVKLLGG